MTPAELHNYIFTNLGLCGCGEPDIVLTFLRNILQVVDSRSEIGTDSTLNHGGDAMRQLVWYFLDDKELVEHGSRADMGWLTADHVDDPAPRHLMAVPVSFVLLTEMVRQGFQSRSFQCVDGIPSDAVLVSSFLTTEPSGSQTANIVFEHESFPLVEAGTKIPEKACRFELVDKTINESRSESGLSLAPDTDIFK